MFVAFRSFGNPEIPMPKGNRAAFNVQSNRIAQASEGKDRNREGQAGKERRSNACTDIALTEGFERCVGQKRGDRGRNGHCRPDPFCTNQACTCVQLACLELCDLQAVLPGCANWYLFCHLLRSNASVEAARQRLPQTACSILSIVRTCALFGPWRAGCHQEYRGRIDLPLTE